MLATNVTEAEFIRALEHFLFLSQMINTSFLQAANRKLLIAAAMFALAFAMLPLSASANGGKAEVIVVHAIPGSALGAAQSLPVDVLVNDSICLLDNFQYKDVVGPVELDPGSYNLKVSLANSSDPCSNDAVIEADASLSAGQDAVIAAFVNADGDAVLKPFGIDLSDTHQARVSVIHLADAPPVDVTLTNPYTGGSINFWYLMNGMTATAEIDPRFYLLSLYNSLTNAEVVGYTPVDFLDGTTYITFAVGSVGAGSFELITKAYDTPGASKTVDEYTQMDIHEYGYDTRVHSRWWENY
jgi:hypothetical protein